MPNKVAAGVHTEDVNCVQSDLYIEALLRTVPLSYVIETLIDDDLKVFLVTFNRAAPVTDYKADKIVAVASLFDPLRYRVVMIVNECVMHDGLMDVYKYEYYKAGIVFKKANIHI